MTDGIIKGTGNSRVLKSVPNAMTLYPTHEALMEALATAGLPVDLPGINPAGWQTVGDKLGKATLLTDAVASALGLSASATPSQAMDKLRQLVNGKAKIVSGSYVGTGTSSASGKISITTGFSPKFVVISRNYIEVFGSASSNNTFGFVLWVPGVSEVSVNIIYGEEVKFYPSADNTSFKFYETGDGAKKGFGFNAAGKTNYYFAIG